MQASLFDARAVAQPASHPHVAVPVAGTGDILYYPGFIEPAEADRYFEFFRSTAAWAQEEIRFYGKRHPMPRLTAWYGDPDATYRYSGVVNRPNRWNEPLIELLADLDSFTWTRFNSVLLNRYRDGNDSISWHADDEAELGSQPTIASISLGTARAFHLRRKQDRKARTSIVLEHGSLLVMKGRSQVEWQHAVLKERRSAGERINLTFRVVGVRGPSEKNLL
jgi:alkylated DNA repair dioxygenase AlkB